MSIILQKPLSQTRRNKITQSTALYKQAIERKKSSKALGVRDIYDAGGKAFVEAVRKYGRTESGTPIKLTHWYSELLELIGDLRVHEIYISGCAQAGKTLSVNTLLCYCLTVLRLRTITFFDQQRTRDRNVVLQFKPLIDRWVQKLELEDYVSSNSSTIFKIGNNQGVFSFANTSRSTTAREGLAVVSSAAAGVTADVLFTDERSQFLPGTAAVLPRRLDASQLPSKPQRHSGTSGGGQGIEKDIAQCDYQFYPHVVCRHCQKTIALHPKGCLIRPVKQLKNGKEIEVYFGESGRPLKWMCKDESNPIATAYIGCSECLNEIPTEDRENAFYQCMKTGIKLRDFLDSIE